jgi:hypothetical protein
MAPGWREVGWNGELNVEGFIGQVIAVEQDGDQRPFVSLVDLERWAAAGPSNLQRVLRIHRTVYDSWRDRAGGVYINKSGR